MLVLNLMYYCIFLSNDQTRFSASNQLLFIQKYNMVLYTFLDLDHEPVATLFDAW